MWCNTLLQCGGGGLPLGLMMNSTREEQPPEVEVFLCVRACARLSIRWLLLWWLDLFIEALALFPNIEREGSQQWRANLKGDS